MNNGLEPEILRATGCSRVASDLEDAPVVEGGPTRAVEYRTEFDSSLPSTCHPTPAPVEIGRYRGVAEIARGGMGIVVRGEDPDLGRPVAIKVAQSASEGAALEKFLLEARIAGRLEHPNIVPVHELGRSADGLPYFSMKLVQGRSLGETIRSMDDAAIVAERSRLVGAFLKVVDAIAFAHSRGVIHRDLKPANVMLGEFGEVLVLDWGLAKVRGEGSIACDEAFQGRLPDSLERTTPGTVLGTLAYMAPEQARGEIDRVDERSDVYALGGILYEILTRTAPHAGSDPAAALERVRRGDLEPPAERAPPLSIPRELAAIVRHAMAADPRDRYARGEDLADDVEAWIHGRAVRAFEYRAVDLAWKWARRHRATVVPAAIGGAVARGLLVAGAVSTSDKNHAIRRERDAALEAKRSETEAKETLRVERDGAWGERNVARARALLLEAERLSGEGRPGSALARLAVSLELDPTERALVLARDLRSAVPRRSWVSPRSDRFLGIARIVRLAFDRSGACLAGGGIDGRVVVWDAVSGRTRVAFEPSGSATCALGYAPDAASIAALDASGILRRLDMGGAEAWRIHVPGASSLAWVDQGRRILVAGPPSGPVLVDAATGREAPGADRFQAATRVGSPDGVRVVTGGADGRLVLREGEAPVTAHERAVRDLAFDPAGRVVASYSDDRVIAVHDLESGSQLARLGLPSVGGIEGLAVAGPGMLAWIATEGFVTSWRWEDRASTSLLYGATALGASGPRVAVASEDQVFFVDPAGRVESSAHGIGHSRPVADLAFDPSGTRLASGGADATVRIWEVATGREAARLEAPHRIGSLAWDPAGERLPGGGAGGTIVVWDARTWVVAARWTAGTTDSPRLAFAPDGKTLLAVASGSARILDARQGEVLEEIGPSRRDRGDEPRVTWAAFHPDGTRLATLWSDGSFRWHYELTGWRGGAPRRLIDGPGHLAALSPDGRRIALVAGDRLLEFDAATGERGLSVDAEGSRGDLVYLPGGRQLARAPYSGDAFLWTPVGNAWLALEGHEAGAASIAASPDGKRIATGSLDGTVRLFDVSGPRPVVTLEPDSLDEVVFDVESMRAVTASPAEDVLRVWDLGTGREVRRLPLLGGGAAVAFVPGGEAIAASSTRGELLVWGAGDDSSMCPGPDPGRRLTLLGVDEGRGRLVAFEPDFAEQRTWFIDLRTLRPEPGPRVAGSHQVVLDSTGTRIALPDPMWTGFRVVELGSGRELARVVGAAGGLPVFSPDGRRIAFDPLGSGPPLVHDVEGGGRRIPLEPIDARAFREVWRALSPSLAIRFRVVTVEELEWLRAAARLFGPPGRPAPPADDLAGRWRIETGLALDAEAGRVVSVPTPGSAYAGDPDVALRCR